jgi:hypothetical protein
MLTPPHFGSPFRHLRRSVLTASILLAALVTQAWAVDWNGPITLDVNPTVGVGLVEGRVDGSPFDATSPNIGNGPDNGFGLGSASVSAWVRTLRISRKAPPRISTTFGTITGRGFTRAKSTRDPLDCFRLPKASMIQRRSRLMA